LRPAVIRPKGK
uniref:Hyposin-H1 n=1 Tax=Pithecopus azureus TaxID=2034991 RepID=HPS1_PITAZ|nr:RecName: Full=Hyposin-H1; Short=HPS-H1; AltName: Full=Hyposin-1; AltName: Full=Hyposin-HA1 [Pithecopus azureus]